MIKQIMLEEITEYIVNFKDSITVTISQCIPNIDMNNFRIVKKGSWANLTSLTNNDDNVIVNGSVGSKHDMLNSYKNLTTALFMRKSNFVRYLKKDYIFNLEPIRK